VREIRQKRSFQPVSLDEIVLEPAMRAQLQEQSLIKRAQFYIASHLHRPLSIDEVAGHVFMSRAYFTRRFRQETGRSFVEYVTDCRLEKAKVLLVNASWPLRRIAEELGISPARLRSIFLQYEGKTPADFRRENRAGEPS
jgi:transcriptional regulator GlxA family with amidase domain